MGESDQNSVVVRVPRDLATGDVKASRIGQRARELRTPVLSFLRSSPAFMGLVSAAPARQLFEVRFSPDTLTALGSGQATWSMNADGTFKAVVRTKTGQIWPKHPSWAPVQDVGAALSQLNNLAVHSALADILARLEDIAEGIDRILRGQRADRYGQVCGGVSLYQQAIAASDPSLKRTLLSAALQSLSEGRSKVLQILAMESGQLKPPSDGELLLKSPVFGPDPNRRLAARFWEAVQDASVAVYAVEQAALVCDELGELEIIPVLIREVAAELKEPVAELRSLALHIPYTPERDPAEPWNVIERRIIQGADQLIASLTSPDRTIALEFDRTDLLPEGK